MYKNIDKKLNFFSKAILVTGAISTLVCGLDKMFEHEQYFTGIATIILGVAASYAVSLLFYAVSHLIQKVDVLTEDNPQINPLVKTLSEIGKISNYKECPGCGDSQPLSNTHCSECGTRLK